MGNPDTEAGIRTGIRPGMIDIHCHILPGLDDGSDSFETSLEMARMAAASGVGTIIATPHANQRGRFENYCTDLMNDRFESLRARIYMEGIPLDLLPGMEIMASRDVVSLIRRGYLCDLAGTGWYLIEFPFTMPGADITAVLWEMLDAGFWPVVAHPERYMTVQRHPENADRWRREGCLLQINTGSVTGLFGTTVQQAALQLLEAGDVDLVGSDAHGTHIRTTDYSDFAKSLRRDGREDLLHDLTIHNPTRLLTIERIHSF